MTYTPDILSLSARSLDYFLSLLPAERITRKARVITIHAECGDAVWFNRGGRWFTAAPGFERARRNGAVGTVH